MFWSGHSGVPSAPTAGAAALPDAGDAPGWPEAPAAAPPPPPVPPPDTAPPDGAPEDSDDPYAGLVVVDIDDADAVFDGDLSPPEVVHTIRPMTRASAATATPPATMRRRQ